MFPIPSYHEQSANHSLRNQQAYFNDMDSNGFRTTQDVANYSSTASLPSALPAVPAQFAAQAQPVDQFSGSHVGPPPGGPFYSGFTLNRMSTEKFQPMVSPAEDQPVLDMHTPVEMDWGYAEEIIPQPTDSFVSHDDTTNMSRNFDEAAQIYDDPFNPTMTNELWTQFDIRDHVDNMFGTP